MNYEVKNFLTVQLVQVNYRYGNNVFLPYSAGCLQSAVQADHDLSSRIKFRESIFERHSIDELIPQLSEVDVLGLSAYIWNWEYVKTLGSKFRTENKNSLIVLGGPQIPTQDPNIFSNQLWFADAVVLGEGEITFREILRAQLNDEPLSEIPGLLIPNAVDGRAIAVSTGAGSRIENLGDLPSPYVMGVFDGLLERYRNLEFQASQETHRGCPYACTFCDWGSATMSRVRRFPIERVTAEYEWMGRNQIDLLYNCDANYGLFKEDTELTRRLVQTHRTYGYPKKFRAAYAKNSNQRVFEIAKLLNDSGMCKGVTLSLQSTDESVLLLIKRKNMQINKFGELVALYRKQDIPTYTELIIGLPGETAASFLNGLNEMLEAGQHDSLNIYHAMVLPNAELNDPAYRELHGVRSVRTPLLLLHGTDADSIQEYNEIVTQTNTMSIEDWISITTLSYVIQAFHCLNLTKKIAIALNRLLNVSYVDFYSNLINWSLENKLGPHKSIVQIQEMCVNVSKGVGSFDMREQRFGDLTWPTEEALFLRMVLVDNRSWLHQFLTQKFSSQIQLDLLGDLIEFQHLSTVYPRLDGNELSETHEFRSDWISITGLDSDVSEANIQALISQKITTTWSTNYPCWMTLQDYAREVVWYGRKGSAIENDVQALPT